MPVQAKKTLKKGAPSRAKPRKPAPRKAVKIPRITYATLALTEKDHAEYDKAVQRVRERLGTHYTNYVNGQARPAQNGQEQKHASPADTRLIVSYFPRATREDTQTAIRAAREAAPAWRALPYKERTKIMRRAADNLIKNIYDISATMAFEVGKNRAEAIAEVNESAELLRYYSKVVEEHKGYVHPLESPGRGQRTASLLRPYGVWGVVSPWNFPMALATGMCAGALVTGNTVVYKPSSESPVTGWYIYQALAEAGIPDGVFNLMVGPGSTVGEELLDNEGIDGLIFTGSKDVGMHLYRNFTHKWPRPIITEMGGKNPAIVTAHADLDQAAEGCARGAFGFDGQKCSATSRIYVHNSVKERFTQLFLEHCNRLVKVGNPTERGIFMGPVINQSAVDTYLDAAREAVRDGGRILMGGEQRREGEFEHGFYVDPCIVDGLPYDNRLFKEELFLPFVVMAGFDTIEEALREANDVEFGLCAGIYSEDKHELEYFFDHIEAGVLYSNRRSGATTGAWPGINSFGGWKGSGSSGKSALGPYYVQQFMREQSRWIVED
ncbi:MAG: aldehyde dehydrogenase family protein [Anaerolineae bacterium]